MAEIKDIPTATIDPKSTVNVRRSQVEEGVEKVKSSIEHGFWRSNPITIRPHPDTSSEYEYEVVVGQCRLRACLDLGLEEIPAVIQEIDDDAAIRQSWDENERRTNLTKGDKVYWIHKLMMRYGKEGKNLGESRQLTADFLEISVPTVSTYEPLSPLPDSVMKMLDEDPPLLRLQDARAIAEYSQPPLMEERAEWISKLDRPRKDAAQKALKKLGPGAPIVGGLDEEVDRIVAKKKGTVEVNVPESLLGKLLQWGEERGLPEDKAIIINHMIVETLRGA